jgi:L-2-hydroxyglutarate oxidase
MSSHNYDTIVVGAGLVGLSVIYHLKLKDPSSKILLIEKEPDVARHQSGHNSGVIHSGIYYKPGSLKAENCLTGYNSLIEFAQENNIPHDICGKIIIATTPGEITELNRIFERGQQNGLKNLKKLRKEELKEIEPHSAGVSGIQVPQTGIIDYPKMAETLLKIFLHKWDGDCRFGEEVVDIHTGSSLVMVKTTMGTYFTKNLVTCAGLFSDRVTNLTEEDSDLRIIPFRGEYYNLKKEKEYLIKNLIYPVPNPKFPFLGVHFTRMINGGVEAGPNAVLAFKREGYRFRDFNSKDFFETLAWPGLWKIMAKYGRTGMGEIYRSLSKTAFTKSLQALVPEITEDDLVPGGAGVRAQACDRKGNLIDDFNILQRSRIIHVRNAPSPAATASLSIGKYICDKIIE